MLKKGDLLNDRYEIIEQIGCGGMSLVYKANCKVLHRLVTIKALRQEFSTDENFVNRFRIEAQAAAALSHDNIVTIYDVGNQGLIYYIVMEYLEGKTLDEYIKDAGKLSERDTLRISLAMLSALSMSHRSNIIHRDIKPQNVMITKNNVVKVMDFGIAYYKKHASLLEKEEEKEEEYLSGSVDYISPEQAKGVSQDERSDIYSWGICMFEMLTGRVPFEGEEAVDIILKHINDPLPKIENYRQGLDERLIKAIEKATAKNIYERYQSADEMLFELKEIYNGISKGTFTTTIKDKISTKGFMKKNPGPVKHIWNKSELEEYSGPSDPYLLWIKLSAVGLAFIIVLVTTIAIYSSKKSKWIPEIAKVPHVLELEINEGRNLLEEAGLVVEVVGEEYSETIPAGNIMQQNYKEDSEVAKGTKIELMVSKGPEMVKVPEVIGMDYEKSEVILEENGFVVNRILQANGEAEVGQVFKQVPEAGEEYQRRGTVAIYVSQGAEEEYVIVPDVLDLAKEDAINALINAGIQVGTTTESFHDRYEKGHVIFMTAKAGDKVKKGYVVDLAVSLGKEPKTKKVTMKINSPFGIDQKQGRIKITLTQADREKVILDENLKSENFPIEISPEGEGVGVITLYLDDVKQYTKQVVFTE